MSDWISTQTERLTAFFEQYGPLGFAVWWAIFLSVWFSFYLATGAILTPESGEESLVPQWVISMFGTKAPRVFAAYLLTQATKPLRFIATLVLTKLLAPYVLGDQTPAVPTE